VLVIRQKIFQARGFSAIPLEGTWPWDMKQNCGLK